MKALFCLAAWAVLLGTGRPAAAQPANWTATVGSRHQPNGPSVTRATAADGRNNVFVTGYLAERVSFGRLLSSGSADNPDLFVGKGLPASAVRFGSAAQRGATTTNAGTQALVVAKYTDNGTSAVFNGSQGRTLPLVLSTFLLEKNIHHC